jgi:hypothetical protein
MKGKLLFLRYIIGGEKAAERKCQYRGPPRCWKLIFNLSQKRKSVFDGIYRATGRKRKRERSAITFAVILLELVVVFPLGDSRSAPSRFAFAVPPLRGAYRFHY